MMVMKLYEGLQSEQSSDVQLKQELQFVSLNVMAAQPNLNEVQRGPAENTFNLVLRSFELRDFSTNGVA